MKNKLLTLIFSFLLLSSLMLNAQKNNPLPHLQKKGTATQLIVHGEPFLVLGGELGNSSSSNTKYMNSLWPTLEKMNLNTVLAPVYWELIEPVEGQFNFMLVDDLLASARERNIKLILLWFGSWKNSMSCYAPTWVKKDTLRFPRARDVNNNPVEILSPFLNANLQADKKAFIELMGYLKKVDSEQNTVIMIQVENEIGMLPCARDYHIAATSAYLSDVPLEFITYLKKNKKELKPEFLEIWKENGPKVKGNWPELFGDNVWMSEIFMAWFFGKYVEEIANAGKEVYPLPMYVNAALNRPNKLPGEYPSAGPLPHLMDVWKVAAPSIDILSPDIYFPEFEKYCKLYNRGGNPLFIPEAKFEPACSAKAYYAFGNHDAMGFSPFSIESTSNPETEPIAISYRLLNQLAPLILEKQGANQMHGVLLSKEIQRDTFELGGYTIVASHDYTLGWNSEAKEDVWPEAGGIIICTGNGEYMVAGNGIVLSFPSSAGGKTATGIDYIDEGSYVDGKWTPLRRLNGDQSHQGRHLRIPMDSQEIQQLKLYRYN